MEDQGSHLEGFYLERDQKKTKLFCQVQRTAVKHRPRALQNLWVSRTTHPKKIISCQNIQAQTPKCHTGGSKPPDFGVISSGGCKVSICRQNFLRYQKKISGFCCFSFQVFKPWSSNRSRFVDLRLRI